MFSHIEKRAIKIVPYQQKFDEGGGGGLNLNNIYLEYKDWNKNYSSGCTCFWLQVRCNVLFCWSIWLFEGKLKWTTWQHVKCKENEQKKKKKMKEKTKTKQNQALLCLIVRNVLLNVCLALK